MKTKKEVKPVVSKYVPNGKLVVEVAKEAIKVSGKVDALAKKVKLEVVVKSNREKTLAQWKAFKKAIKARMKDRKEEYNSSIRSFLSRVAEKAGVPKEKDSNYNPKPTIKITGLFKDTYEIPLGVVGCLLETHFLKLWKALSKPQLQAVKKSLEAVLVA